jgi:hypothetical protein
MHEEYLMSIKHTPTEKKKGGILSVYGGTTHPKSNRSPFYNFQFKNRDRKEH